MDRHVRWALPTFIVLIFALALSGVRANGDAREYVLMAHAWGHHAAPDIRKDDVAWLLDREPFLVRFVARDELGRDDVPARIPAIVRAADGRYYSMHFWLYSLLAAPLVWLADLLSVRPLLALTAVNACVASACAAYLLRFFRGSLLAFAAPVLFLLTGTIFYLHWTGPEVLTAACVLIACLAGARGQIGVGFLAAGVAASQNPSAAAVLLLVLANWLALRFSWWPSVIEGARASSIDRREVVLLAGGSFLLLLPYVFFQATFGLPSLIEQAATNRALIGADRAWSLFFDLNQGMFVALPGLLLSFCALSALGFSRGSAGASLRLVPFGILVVAAVAVMSVPTLSIHNWNSGGLVLHRYATWLAMPLLAFVLVALPNVKPMPARAVAVGFAAAQLVVLAGSGLSAEPTRYMQHGAAAAFVLGRWPALYNPVPEIFVERTLGREVDAPKDKPIVWPSRSSQPRKILVHDQIPLKVSRGCQPEQILVGATETRLSGGWRYVNAPFRCAAP